MIIAGFRTKSPAEVSRELRERMSKADEVGEPRSGEHHPSESQQESRASTEGPPVRDGDPAN